MENSSQNIKMNQTSFNELDGIAYLLLNLNKFLPYTVLNIIGSFVGVLGFCSLNNNNKILK